MSQYAILNPRRRRRRKAVRRRASASARASGSGTRRRRRHRNPAMYLLNRRTRRRGRRRNPSLFGARLGGRQMKLFGVDIGAAGWTAGGMIGTGVVTNLVAGLPAMPAMLKAGVGRTALKAGVAVGISLVVGKVFGRNAAALMGVGGLASVMVDAYKQAAEKIPQLPGVGDYEASIGDYEPVTTGFGALPSSIPAPNRDMWNANWSV